MTVILAVGPATALYNIFTHANLDWDFGPLRRVLVSPNMHRWHHTPEQPGLQQQLRRDAGDLGRDVRHVLHAQRRAPTARARRKAARRISSARALWPIRHIFFRERQFLRDTKNRPARNRLSGKKVREGAPAQPRNVAAVADQVADRGLCGDRRFGPVGTGCAPRLAVWRPRLHLGARGYGPASSGVLPVETLIFRSFRQPVKSG